MINCSLASSSIRKYQMKLVGDRFRIGTVHHTIPIVFWNSDTKLRLCSNFAQIQKAIKKLREEKSIY